MCKIRRTFCLPPTCSSYTAIPVVYSSVVELPFEVHVVQVKEGNRVLLWELRKELLLVPGLRMRLLFKLRAVLFANSFPVL